jgi:mRNA-degrading endonuclease RelE of RelBE toxin-antitoxin system
MAKVVVQPKAQEEFIELPLPIQVRMEKVFSRLELWPAVSGVKALSGNFAGWYRIRTGDYRILFRVVRVGSADTVVVERIGHRDRFYED